MVIIDNSTYSAKITTTKVSSIGQYGGAMFWGHADGDTNIHVNVIGNAKLFPKPVFVEKGDIWKITGIATSKKRKAPNGFSFYVTTVAATSAELIKSADLPLSEALKTVVGVGESKIEKLFCTFDEATLKVALDTHDTVSLRTVLTNETADRIITWWHDYGKRDDYNFFLRFKFKPKTVRHIIQFFSPQPKQRLSENPYALLSLTNNFSLVDSVAIAGYGLTPTDPRRLYALAEKSLYDMLDGGNTATTENLLKQALSKNLRNLGVPGITIQSVRDIWNSKCDGQVHYDKSTGLISPLAAYSIERDIYFKLDTLLNKKEAALPEKIHQPSKEEIDSYLDEFNSIESERLGIDNFSLNYEQRLAVHTALQNRASLITGDAGTGKTSVLRALYYVLDICGFTYYQQAISGRATKRMREATDRHDDSYTVAGFLKSINAISDSEPSYVVIDEAAMVDTWNLWRVFNTLGKRTRIILVGDPDQLPPVGPGKTLHLFAECNAIPQVTLIDIVRQAGDCAIPEFSRAMRTGSWVWVEDTALEGVEVIQCKDSNIINAALNQYDSSPADTQILSATYKNKFSGINTLNKFCQKRYNPDGEMLLLYNTDESSYENTGFRVGDPLLMMRNDWSRDLANGSMGKLVEIFDTPIEVILSHQRTELALGQAIWDDGETQPIFLSDILQENISLSYCMSVHKAQGSEFPRIIIPIPSTRSMIIDRCWLYTAVTRAKNSVVLVGDVERMKQVVRDAPIASKRITGLEPMLKELG